MRRRGGLAVATLLLASGTRGTQAVAAPQQPPEFPAQAEIVTLDVVVLDRDGRPVPGLTRADFVVKEDGRSQTVTAFEEVDAVVPAVLSPETRRSRLAVNVSAPPTRRTFAIVFDDVHVGDLDLEQAKRAVEEFASRHVVAGDRLALFTVSDGRYWTTTRGAADGAWMDALDGIRSRQRLKSSPACTITHYEANRIEEFADCVVCQMVARRLGDLGCTEYGLDCTRVHGNCSSGDAAGAGEQGAPPGMGPLRNWMPVVEARGMGRTTLDRSLMMLREVARSLTPLPGRKQLILVSEGFVADPTLAAFRDVREQAARANVAIHFLDPRGLLAMPEFLSAAGGRGAMSGRDLALTLALWPLESAGSKALAEETGGRVLQTNDMVAGLAQVADESRVTYLLGYEPTNTKRDGRYRKLKVEVLRPGLEVRARAGYFAEKGRRKKPATEPSVVDRVLASPFDADGIPLRLAAYVMGPAPLQSPVPKTGVEVLVAGEVRLDAFATRVKDGRTVAEPKLKLFASSRTRETHESEWSLEVTLTPLAEKATAAQAWHPFLTRIAMEPGDHRARLAVESGGRVGSVTLDFMVPDPAEERLATPVLSDQLVVGPGARRVMPVVRRDFPSSSTLHAWFELHGAAVDSEEGRPRATAAFAVRSADGREWASGPPTPMNVEARRPTRLVSLPLADAPPGESEIVLTVRDEVSGRTFAAREPFRVERVAPAGNGGQ